MTRTTALLPLILLFAIPGQAGEPIETAFVASGVQIVGGELGAVADLLNPVLQEQFDTGGLRNLLEVQNLDDLSMQNDPEVQVASFPGIDQDGDPGNDFDGNNLFQVDPLGLNANGQPLTVFTPGSITNGLLIAGPADLDLGGGLVIPGTILEGTIAVGGSSLTTPPIAAAIPVAVFDAIPAPAPFNGFPFNYDTLTEVLGFFGVNPDVDIDGDGVFDAFSVEFVLAFVSCQIIYPSSEPLFLRGDINDDGTTDLSDAINLLDYLFTSGAEPSCYDGADTNDDGALDLADVILVLSYLFTGGPPPEDPFVGCGSDPTADSIDCLTIPGSC
ncbi:MAG: hypothetical protein OSB09_03580 [Planctomycetota bacterium]|nr:hypothetical protein [Planctomycetota bacterium]